MDLPDGGTHQGADVTTASDGPTAGTGEFSPGR
jgi:hypothetical protein